ncbi:hypothetical protein FNV43_RR08289 [Rhamnella rubrinervis]|uniref:Uncharacterized protein n=1 Tax=Rhamnella rubrinervis TaxID=2594499 RepID=A0A8K0HG90_9ROSA|nr:hypothetical protein FNV43_RR08289 [Rhamnella rubrinervis]
MFAFLSQVMVTRRRLEPRNMLTKTSELRVRSVEGTTLPPRKKNSPALQPTDPVDHITGRERVTLEIESSMSGNKAGLRTDNPAKGLKSSFIKPAPFNKNKLPALQRDNLSLSRRPRRRGPTEFFPEGQAVVPGRSVRSSEEESLTPIGVSSGLRACSCKTIKRNEMSPWRDMQVTYATITTASLGIVVILLSRSESRETITGADD